MRILHFRGRRGVESSKAASQAGAGKALSSRNSFAFFVGAPMLTQEKKLKKKRTHSSAKMRAAALLAVLAVASLSFRGAEAQLSVSRKEKKEKKRIKCVVVIIRVASLHLLDNRSKKLSRPRPLLSKNSPLRTLSPLTKPKKQAIQSAEETALNAYSAFKSLQLGERREKWRRFLDSRWFSLSSLSPLFLPFFSFCVETLNL